MFNKANVYIRIKTSIFMDIQDIDIVDNMLIVIIYRVKCFLEQKKIEIVKQL